MERMDVNTGELPVEKTLCVFKTKLSGSFFIMGYLIFNDEQFLIKEYGKKSSYYKANDFYMFEYILNENRGFYFINGRVGEGPTCQAPGEPK